MTDTSPTNPERPKRFSPLFRGLVSAVVFVSLMFGLDWFTFAAGPNEHGGPVRDYWWIYAALLAASALLMVDVVDTATLARRDAGRWSADGWMYAYAVGASWGVPMTLIMWRPDIDAWINVAIWGGAGALFGLWMNLLFHPDKPTYHKRFGGFDALEHFYSDWKSIQEQKFGGAVYYWWPFIVIGLIALMASTGSEDAYHNLVIGWQLVLMTSIMARRQAPGWAMSPRLPGTVIFICAVVASYMTTLP